MINSSQILFLTVFSSLFLQFQSTQQIVTVQQKNVIEKVLDVKEKLTQSYFISERKCGLNDEALYIKNGTYETIGFYSNTNFSLMVEQQSIAIVFTGFAISKPISHQKLQNYKKQIPKMYHLQMNLQTNSNQTQTNKNNLKNLQQKTIYFAFLDVYSICRTVSVSTASTNIQIKITYMPLSHQNQQKAQKFDQNQYRQVLKIPATVYCIDESSIQQANYFITNLYYVLIASLFGFVIHFSPFQKVPLLVRISFLIGYVYASLYGTDWYIALITTYAGIIFTALIYRLFEQRQTLRMFSSRKTLLTKAIMIASLGSFIPLAMKSHLGDPNLQPKRFILHIVNIVMLCNSALVVSSLVNIRRFRHAFYYLLVFAFVENFWVDGLKESLTFRVVTPQIFPAICECDSFFFMIWLIPLCDFFFEEYTSEKLLKFTIILIPLLLKPFNISFSFSFVLIFLIWTSLEALNGRDIVKIIKYKR